MNERVTPAPTVSIVVVTSDRPVDLRRCLGELRAHLADTTASAEVLTVHGPRDDEAIAMVQREFPSVHVHRAEQRHISRQRNQGARAARGRVIVFLDDDAWPRRGWLDALLRAFDDEAVVAASGPVFRGDDSLQCERLAASALGRLVPLPAGRPLPTAMAPSFSGCNLAIRRAALFACGGFDENLPYQPDDMDVCRRLFLFAERDPQRLRYCEGAAVHHESSPGPYRRTLEDRAWFTVARDNVYFAMRHAGVVRGACGGALLQLPKLLRFVRWCADGRLSPAAAVRCFGKHLFGTFAGLAKGLRQARLPLCPIAEAAPPRTVHATPAEELPWQPPTVV